MLRKIVLWALGIVAVLFVAIQFVPYGRDHTNPPVLGEPTWSDAETKVLFDRSCADCHSNETKWPWYSNVAPVSWLVWRDIDEGRAKFNVSEWGHRRMEVDEAGRQVQEGEMPMPIYLVMHPEARLSAAEKTTLINGLNATFGGEGMRPSSVAYGASTR